jgi:hypothetical protein
LRKLTILFFMLLFPSEIQSAESKITLPKVAMHIYDSEFKSDFDGTTQKYLIGVTPDFDTSKIYDLMIFFDGHGSKMKEYFYDPMVESHSARESAIKYKMVFVMPDYSAPMLWLGQTPEKYTIQLIGELKKKLKVGKIFFHGDSLGGTFVLTFAAAHPDLVDGVSSHAGIANLLEYNVNFMDIQDEIKKSLGGKEDETPEEFKKRNIDAYKKYSIEFCPEKFTMPVATVAGGKDKICPSQSILRFAKVVKKRNKNLMLLYREKNGHDLNYNDTDAAIDFIIKAAKKKSNSSK